MGCEGLHRYLVLILTALIRHVMHHAIHSLVKADAIAATIKSYPLQSIVAGKCTSATPYCDTRQYIPILCHTIVTLNCLYSSQTDMITKDPDLSLLHSVHLHVHRNTQKLVGLVQLWRRSLRVYGRDLVRIISS